MPAERVTRRKVKGVLRLHWGCGLSQRQLAKRGGVARPTVAESLRRAAAAGLSWPLPPDLDEGPLERLRYPLPAALSGAVRPLPRWPAIHREWKRPGVTLFLLWQEYKAMYPDGSQDSAFCTPYRHGESQLALVMRQSHRAGETLFIDDAGPTVPVIDRTTGAGRAAPLLVAVLGASSDADTEATWPQSLPDWIGSPIRVFEFFQVLPDILVPANRKSGVSSPHRYEPALKPTDQDMAAHYGVAVIPTRVRKPRDKAKVEQGVRRVDRWVLARLRNRVFFSLAELNTALHVLLDDLTRRPFKKLPGCRRERFEQLDRPAMKALPAQPDTEAEWRPVRVHID